MPVPESITIDGPAASGKSTVGRLLADRLGYLYFDTGATYRAVTLLALERGLDPDDGAGLGRVAAAAEIDLRPPAAGDEDGRHYSVLVDGRDVTWEIRHHLVDQHVSRVAAHPAVRRALTEQQRRIGLRGQVVLVGRDIGTVVLPEAPLKIYLDASAEERARRRHRESAERGGTEQFETLLHALRERDRFDSSRADAPLRAAEDAVWIDCDRMSAEEVVEEILGLWEERAAAAARERP